MKIIRNKGRISFCDDSETYTWGAYYVYSLNSISLITTLRYLPNSEEQTLSEIENEMAKEGNPRLMILSKEENSLLFWNHTWKGAEIITETKNVRTGHSIKILRWN